MNIKISEQEHIALGKQEMLCSPNGSAVLGTLVAGRGRVWSWRSLLKKV